MDRLLSGAWVLETPDPWFQQMPKYVRAIARRLERARGDVERDRRLAVEVEPFVLAFDKLASRADADRATPELERLRWMIEEFRLSLFAQELKTLQPVSAKRLEEQLRLAKEEAARG
jgi:ATP-dependent helicase HrpA